MGYLRALAVVLAMAAALPIVLAYATPPANDNFADAIVISSLPYNVNAQSVSDSTFETVGGEPQPCYPVASTVWYSFTPNQAGVVNINTAGSTYDTVAAVYTGTSLNGLTQVACNDDTGPLLTSAVQFSATSGETYWIQIGSVDVPPADLTLNIVWATTPENDNFADAITVSPIPYTDTKSTIVATTETGEPPDCAGHAVRRTVWYNFTPSSFGMVTIDTLGSDFDRKRHDLTGSIPWRPRHDLPNPGRRVQRRVGRHDHTRFPARGVHGHAYTEP